MFSGVLTALVTPFRDGTVDEAALRELVEWQIGAGVDGLVPCGSTGEAATLSAEMARHGVEFIEQPLPPEAREAQAQLFRDSALPIIADENCVGEADVPLCVDHFHGINIKLCKCGGLTPARRMIAAARDHGLKVMVGCMTESSVGISAAAQLTPLLDYADLDGAVLLAQDAADGVQLHQGQLTFPNEPGLGIRALK